MFIKVRAKLYLQCSRKLLSGGAHIHGTETTRCVCVTQVLRQALLGRFQMRLRPDPPRGQKETQAHFNLIKRAQPEEASLSVT